MHNMKILDVTNNASGSKGSVYGGALYLAGLTSFVNFEIVNVTNTAGINGDIDGGAMYIDSDASMDQATIANVVSKTLGTSANSPNRT